MLRPSLKVTHSHRVTIDPADTHAHILTIVEHVLGVSVSVLELVGGLSCDAPLSVVVLCSDPTLSQIKCALGNVLSIQKAAFIDINHLDQTDNSHTWLAGRRGFLSNLSASLSIAKSGPPWPGSACAGFIPLLSSLTLTDRYTIRSGRPWNLLRDRSTVHFNEATRWMSKSTWRVPFFFLGEECEFICGDTSQ